MYEQLLLTAGGGIIDRVQQSEQDSCAVVAIGLGGTGSDCLRSLKEKIYNRVKPDDPDAVVPEYKHIRFLAVDTDRRAMRQRAEKAAQSSDGALGELDMSSEFFDISYDKKISELFKTLRTNLARDRVYNEWLQFDKINAAEADNGAGGIRQLGRFLLMQKAEQFVAKVQELIRQAMTGLGVCPVYVHIFSGMSGGTGAGTFLDVCYLVQRALANEGVGNYKTMGYFFLPDVNLAQEGLPTETRTYIRSNGYASMQELDYCMNFEHNGDSWHQAYPGGIGDIVTSRPPVEWCHLVSATTSAGAVVPEAYSYALNVVTDYVMDFLVRPDDVNSINLESHFSNVTSYKTYVRKAAGACYDYLVLGAASAVIPFKQVLTYLASGVFAGFEDVQRRVPTQQESESFQKRIGLTYDQVLNRVRRNVDLSFPNPEVKAKDAQDNEKLVVSWFQEMQANGFGALAKNYADLSAEPATYAPPADAAVAGSRSLIAAVLAEVRSIMVNPELGPAYAAALVSGTAGSDLIAACEGVREQARQRRDHEQYQLDSHIYQSQKQAQNAFRSAKFGSRYAKLKPFINHTRNAYLTEVEVKTYQTVMDLMDTLKDQLRRMSNNFTGAFRKTMADLFSVFAANRTELEAFADKKNPYETPLVEMKELLPTLNSTLRELDVTSVARELMADLISPEGVLGWGPNGDESLLAHRVSRFFLDRFSAYSSRSLSDFLKDKYNTTNPTHLANFVYNDLLRVVNDSAAPLFWSEMGYKVTDACAIGYVTVPQMSPAVVEAAGMLAKAETTQKLTVRETTVRDRISILRCLTGVPMWGYKGVKQYEADSAPRAGKHLYERAEYVEGVSPADAAERSRDWSLLPSPTPLSVMSDQNDPAARERAQAAVDLYDKALAAGVVEKTPAGYEIRFLDDAFMANFHGKFTAAKDKPNDVKLETQAELKGLSEKRVYDSQRIILSTELRSGNEDIERILCIDKLGEAPRLQEKIRAELAKAQEIDADIEALEPKVDKDFDGFRKGLFTGVIELKLPLITYTDEFGDQTVLSKLQMEHGGVPLYQAYLSFKGMDPALREQIAREADEVLSQDVLPDQVTEACSALKEELANKRDFVAIANEEFPREVADVKELARNLEDALSVFVRRYRIRVK